MAILTLCFERVRPRKATWRIAWAATKQPCWEEDHGARLIAANIQALIEQLKADKSDALTAYLDPMSRFHRYSFGNVLAIARQRPGATHVAGFHAWRQLGRYVRKGERGICILAPIINKRKQRDEPEHGEP
jgi:hypothetical protein